MVVSAFNSAFCKHFTMKTEMFFCPCGDSQIHAVLFILYVCWTLQYGLSVVDLTEKQSKIEILILLSGGSVRGNNFFYFLLGILSLDCTRFVLYLHVYLKRSQLPRLITLPLCYCNNNTCITGWM